MRQVGCVIPIVAVLLTNGGQSFGQTYVELDGDGILGNGPDVVFAAPGDTIRVDVYLHHTGDGVLCYVEIPLCTACAAADSLHFWTLWASWSVPGDSCLQLVGSDVGSLCDTAVDMPIFFASAWYIAEECPCEVLVDDAESYWHDGAMGEGTFSGSVPIWLCGEQTATEEGSWGAVKELFR